MASLDPLGGGSGGALVERADLIFSFHAHTLRHAAALAAELRAVAARAPRIHAVKTSTSDRRDWIVTVTTSQVPLTATVLGRWEQELLAVERRRPGSRFLGWRIGRQPDGPARDVERRSQRQLVVASLLRNGFRENERSARRRPGAGEANALVRLLPLR